MAVDMHMPPRLSKSELELPFSLRIRTGALPQIVLPGTWYRMLIIAASHRLLKAKNAGELGSPPALLCSMLLLPICKLDGVDDFLKPLLERFGFDPF